MFWFKRQKTAKPLVSERKGVSDGTAAPTQTQSVERHERIFKGGHGYGFLDWELDTSTMVWNGGFWAYLGYGDSDMVFISDSGRFLEYVHQDDRERLSEDVRSLLRRGGAQSLSFRIRKKRGGYVWTEVRVDSVRNDQGWVKYVSGILFDVTKLKQTEQALLVSEARHARILQSSNDGIWEWSAEHGSFHFSNRCWEHLGYSDDDDLVNQGIDRVQAWKERIHPDDLILFDQRLRDHIHGKCPFDVEYRIRGKDEKWRWIRARGQTSFNDKGKPVRMSGTNMNITELKSAEARVVKAKDAAEKANQAKSDFLSSMSHELRTPLNAILGFAQLFDLDRSLNETQHLNIVEIKRAGEHLLQLVGDVLDLAKIEAGRMGLSMEPVAPSRLLREVDSLLRSQADLRHIQLRLNLNELDDITVVADAVRLKQVLLNLVSNAVKYNRDGGKVEIDCRKTDAGLFQIAVRDTGIGISQELQQHLFQPFNRLGAEGSAIEGSGVGLVITKQLVKKMGGVLGFRSEEGHGSTFWVEFPEYTGQSIDEVANSYLRPASSISQEIPDLEVSGNKRILYVEDNPPNQRLMEQLLARYPNLELTVADEPLRGIFLARTTQPDLVIMDINLPGMDGFEAVSILKQDEATSAIPVIALTANAMAQDVEKGKAFGFVYYLTKPVNLAALIDVFNELLG